MNAEQKQRAKDALTNCQASDMAALLQELVDAPEADPFAVIHLDGSFVHVEFKQTVAGTGKFEVYAAPPVQSVPEPEPFGYFKSEPFGWTDCAETDDGAIALYELPPAPSVPDGWRLVPYTPTVLMLERAGYAVNNRPQPSKYEPSATPAIIFWTAMLNYAPEAPTPAEAQADVARDAERLDWLDERNAPHGLGWEIIQMPAGNVHIHTLTGDKAKFGSIRDAIDAAMSEKGGKA